MGSEMCIRDSVAPVVEQLLAPKSEVNVNLLPTWLRAQIIQAEMRGGGEPQVRVAADVRLNAVVISGPPASLDGAEPMGAPLDVDPTAVSYTHLTLPTQRLSVISWARERYNLLPRA